MVCLFKNSSFLSANSIVSFCLSPIRQYSNTFTECLTCSTIIFQELFLGRPIGLFSLLDEESHFPRATDLSLGQSSVCIYQIFMLLHYTCRLF